MTLPNSLLYICDRLAGFSTNIFKIQPNGSSSATANQIVTFDLPSNSIIHTRSFKVFFKATLTGTTARLPADIHSLIERVEISSGGVLLSQGSNFHNVIHMAKKALCCDMVGNPLAHTEIVRSKSYFDGSTMSGTAAESPSGFLCWNQWDDTFLGSCEPGFLDTALLPDLRVRIYLAPNAVLSSSAGVALTSFVTNPTTPAASYTLSEISANIECVSFGGGGLYDDMVDSLVNKGGFLEMPFKSIHTFSGLHSGSTRFSVSSQSLDRVWLAWRDSSYATLGAPSAVAGFKSSGAFVSTTAGAATSVDVGLPGYDAGGIMGTNSERYIGKYFRFQEPASGVKAQLQLNGAYFPQYLAGSDEWLEITRNSVDQSHFRCMTPHQYKDSYYVQCVRLNFPHSEKLRMLSGLDCRGVNLDGVVQTEGAGSSHNLTIFTESTSTLRIGKGREIQVIH